MRRRTKGNVSCNGGSPGSWAGRKQVGNAGQGRVDGRVAHPSKPCNICIQLIGEEGAHAQTPKLYLTLACACGPGGDLGRVSWRSLCYGSWTLNALRMLYRARVEILGALSSAELEREHVLSTGWRYALEGSGCTAPLSSRPRCCADAESREDLYLDLCPGCWSALRTLCPQRRPKSLLVFTRARDLLGRDDPVQGRTPSMQG
ncbi:hypothetical protein BDV96DRAFT_568995 [Lophiotrema nucula]|uniref:Uncharacterized protein n=1 Tax=Lophiotrema nucula TaxID=690887 RepID=A0A6A5ZHX5_9PLEO|nr:hypothetical protein BDV96DRAFT_568995 [Lophiotrema nucula]